MLTQFKNPFVGRRPTPAVPADSPGPGRPTEVPAEIGWVLAGPRPDPPGESPSRNHSSISSPATGHGTLVPPAPRT